MNGSRSTYLLLTLFLGQIMLFSLGALTLQYYQVLEGLFAIFAAVFIFFNYITTVFFCKRLFQADYQAVVMQNQEGTLQKLESTLGLVRFQRHDIVNHLQTIYALLQMGKDQRAKKYVGEIGLITANSSRVIRLGKPEIAGFLQSKQGQALAKDIKFNIEILTDLEKCTVKPYFWITILGTLLDKAFETVEDLPASERLVELELTQQEDVYKLVISNSGSGIEESPLEKIFKHGYFTEGAGGEYGLFFVRDAVLNHGGSIEVRNDPAAFIVTIPNKKREDDGRDSSIGSKTC